MCTSTEWALSAPSALELLHKAPFKHDSAEYISGLTNLWNACPKYQTGSFSWHAAFTAAPIAFISFVQMQIIRVNVHMSDCTETVYELPLLPENTASEKC
jgi:hypothetical protein